MKDMLIWERLLSEVFPENQLSLWVSLCAAVCGFSIVSFFVSQPQLTDSIQRRSSNFDFL